MAFVTAREIAERAGVALHAARYFIDSRKIRPTVTISGNNGYAPDVAEQVVAALKAPRPAGTDG